MDLRFFIDLAGIIVAIVSLIIAFNTFKKQMIATREQMKATKDQMALNFFADYTKRYQEIMLNMPYEVNNKKFDFDKLKDKKKDNVLKYMRAYFDLCSEEYYLYLNNKLPYEVWNEWEEGIKYSFNKKAFVKGWHIINMDSQFYSQFVEWINNKVITE